MTQIRAILLNRVVSFAFVVPIILAGCQSPAGEGGYLEDESAADEPKPTIRVTVDGEEVTNDPLISPDTADPVDDFVDADEAWFQEIETPDSLPTLPPPENHGDIGGAPAIPLIPGSPEEADVVPSFPRADWNSDPRKARKQATKEGKHLFMLFMSGERFPGSRQFREDLFNSRRFNEFARENLILTYLDFPSSFGTQEKGIRKRKIYMSFKDYFKIKGYPEAIVMDKNGNVIHRIRGYQRRKNLLGQIDIHESVTRILEPLKRAAK